MILMSNASFWMEAINTATFEIESWNPSSNGIHREGPEAMTECWHVALWGSFINPFRVSRSAASDMDPGEKLF